MYHACVPLNPDGTLKEVNIYGKTYKGKALFDAVDKYVRDAFTAKDPESRKRGCDLLWYLWLEKDRLYSQKARWQRSKFI